MNLFTELKRRHVFRIGIAYLVVSWLVLQVIGVVTPMLDLPLWLGKTVLILLAVGFPIALVIAWAFELTPEGVKRTDELDEAAPRRVVSTGRKLDFVIIGALVIAVAFLGWRLYGRTPTETAAQSASATTGAMPTVAVLPFANLSDDKSQEYFADGLSDALMDKLASLKGLEVTGRTSSFYFKGKNEDLQTIGEKLGVADLLTGSVAKSGDRLRITAQLINAKTGYQVWSETYDRRLEDVFAIQDDISKSVATALSITLGVGDLGRMEGGTRNVAAYDAYLKAQPGQFSATTSLFRSLIESLQEAVRLDPSYAQAWAQIAATARILVLFDPANAADWKKKADDALARARDVAPDAEIVLSQSAAAAVGQGNWAEAERLYRKAIDLHGDSAVALDYGNFLLRAGKAKQAIDQLVEARRIDPLSNLVAFPLGTAYAHAGDAKQALAELDRGISMGANTNSDMTDAIITALGMHDRDEIEKRIKAIKAFYNANNVGDEAGYPVSTLQSLLDHPQDARAELQRLYRDPKFASPFGQNNIAQWAAYFGDTDLALAALKGSVSPDSGYDNLFAIWTPLLSDARKLPGFKDVVRKIGLVDYWRQYGWGDFCHPVGDNDFECS